MKLTDIVKIIQEVNELPGWEAQSNMAVPYRKNYTYEEVKDFARPASVLVLFYERNGETVFPLNLRHKYDGVHSDQIGLPGGARDQDNETHEETALRETEEELGIKKEKINIIRPISPIFVPPSQFLVNPFVGFLEEVPMIVKDSVEVREVIELRIEDLLDERNKKMSRMKFYNFPVDVPAFVFDDKVIWGATAMILSEVVAMIKK